MKRFMTVVAIWLATTMSASAAAAGPLPDQIAREVTEKIVALIKTNHQTYANDYGKLYAMVEENLLPHFEFRKIAQQVLGPRWRNASAEQRDGFTREFRDLLVRTYGTVLLKYTDQKITYLPVRIAAGDRTAVVRSRIDRGGGAPMIAINYNFLKTPESWKVYDMAIEGPSIVTTYRRVYAERLQKEALDTLIASMAEENKRAASGGGAK